MTITPFKDRDVFAAGEVAVYRDLRTKDVRWSIVALKGADNRGEKLASATEVTLTGCRMIVKESRRQAIAAGAPREVCAWIIGKLASDVHMPDAQKITFHPHERELFFNTVTGSNVRFADAVHFDTHGNAMGEGF